MVIVFGHGRTWGRGGQGGGRGRDMADDNRDNNAMVGYDTVEAAREEVQDYEAMEDFAKSSKGMAVEATQVNYTPVNALMTSLAREPQCNDNSEPLRMQQRHNRTGTTMESAHHHQLES
jgi:hypothetical protein